MCLESLAAAVLSWACAATLADNCRLSTFLWAEKQVKCQTFQNAKVLLCILYLIHILKPFEGAPEDVGHSAIY